MSIEEQISTAVQAAITPLINTLQQGIGNLLEITEMGLKLGYKNGDLLTEKQVGELLKIEPTTLQQWRSTAKYLPFVKAGGSVRYRYGDVQSFILRNVQKVMDERGRII